MISKTVLPCTCIEAGDGDDGCPGASVIATREALAEVARNIVYEDCILMRKDDYEELVAALTALENAVRWHFVPLVEHRIGIPAAHGHDAAIEQARATIAKHTP